MQILSSEKNEVQRKDGHIRGFLHLCLPRVALDENDGKEAFAIFFQDFYTSLAVSYRSTLSSLVNLHIKDEICGKINGVIRASVSYQDVTDEYLKNSKNKHKCACVLAIKRTLLVQIPGYPEFKKTSTDIFDTERAILLK